MLLLLLPLLLEAPAEPARRILAPALQVCWQSLLWNNLLGLCITACVRAGQHIVAQRAAAAVALVFTLVGYTAVPVGSVYCDTVEARLGPLLGPLWRHANKLTSATATIEGTQRPDNSA